MNKWLKSILTLTVLMFGMFVGGTTSFAADKPHYTIATDTTYPPFEFQDKDGEYRGIDMDMLKAISKEEGFTYTLKPMSFNAGVQAIQAGQVDGLLAGMSITPERKQSFDFSVPYYKTGVVIAVNGKDKDNKSLDDLKGKKVAVKTGTAGAQYAQSIAKEYDLKLSFFNDSNTMYNDVKVGNTVAAFEDQPVMAYAINQGTDMNIITKPVNTGGYGFGVKKGDNAELLKSFDKGYDKLVKSGEYDKIVQNYLGDNSYNYKKNAANEAAAKPTIWNILKENKSALLDGLFKTIQLTLIGIILASIWGMLLAVMGVMPSKIMRGISTSIIYLFRGLPMLVLAFFIYIGLPNLTGSKIPAFTAGVITLVLNEGAYIASFVKGGFLSVDKDSLKQHVHLECHMVKQCVKL